MAKICRYDYDDEWDVYDEDDEEEKEDIYFELGYSEWDFF